MGIGQEILILGVRELAGSVNEKHIAVSLGLVEKKDRSGDAGAEEEVCGQADDSLQEIFLNQLLADPTFGSATK